MGQILEQHAILAARGLSLGHVGQHDRASADQRSTGAGDRPHLRRSRKRGAAAAEQAGLLDEIDQRTCATPFTALGERRLAVSRQVLPQAHRTVRRYVCEQPWQAGGIGLRAHRLEDPVSNEEGVPERRAQSCPSGPPGSHSTRNSVKTAVALSAAPRTRAWSGQPEIARTPTAGATIPRQATFSASSHVLFTSLPVPRPCNTAIGQQA